MRGAASGPEGKSLRIYLRDEQGVATCRNLEMKASVVKLISLAMARLLLESSNG